MRLIIIFVSAEKKRPFGDDTLIEVQFKFRQGDNERHFRIKFYGSSTSDLIIHPESQSVLRAFFARYRFQVSDIDALVTRMLEKLNGHEMVAALFE